MDVQEILSSLNDITSQYPRDAVQAAMDHKDEIAPPLLELLDRMLEDPASYAYPAYDSFNPVFAVYCLGYHRIQDAHEKLIALASLTGETPFDLFDDGIHEAFPEALWQTSGGNKESIIGLIENRDANGYCRSAAISALSCGVADGTLSRDETVEFLKGLFTGDEASKDDLMIWNSAASELVSLWPGDSRDVLEKAFDDDLIDPFFIAPEDIESELQTSKEERLKIFQETQLRKLNGSLHESLEPWARSRSYPDLGLFFKQPHSAKHKRSDSIKKRKQARDSRKKNRPKKKKKK